ncbi:MAG: hypothetical protein AAGA90_21140 [Actinomycetota bacterium]
MDLERRTSEPARSSGLPFPAKIALGGLAVWGAINLLQWVVFSALRFIQLGLFIVIIVSVAGWVLSSKASR